MRHMRLRKCDEYEDGQGNRNGRTHISAPASKALLNAVFEVHSYLPARVGKRPDPVGLCARGASPTRIEQQGWIIVWMSWSE